MKHWLIQYTPLLLLLILFWWALSFLISTSLAANDGHLVYALDDPYIHLTIAKNLILRGTWGITLDKFSSSSSSLLWPVLNAGVFLFTGSLETAPLWLNLIFATLLVIAMYIMVARLNVPGWMAGIISGGVVIVAPIPVMVLSGMEHVLHFLLSLIISAITVETCVTKTISNRQISVLAVGLFLLTSVRYEGIFLAVVILGLLVYCRFYRAVLIGGFASAFPIVAYGVWSIRQGWFFFPNPVLLKAKVMEAESIGEWFSELVEFSMSRLDKNPEISSLLAFSVLFLLVYLVIQPQHFKRLAWMFLIYLGMLVPHILFANFGWFYRYEMYLVGMGILLQLSVLALLLLDGYHSKQILQCGLRIAIVSSAIWVAYPLFLPRINTLKVVVQATQNIYQQQYQMARFLNKYYQDVPVAVNDIGSVSFYSQVRLVDLWGLADRDIAAAWLAKRYNTAQIDAFTRQHNVQIALVYDAWFQNTKRLPESWKRVGQWTIRNNIVCGDATVSIYAVDANAASILEANLRLYKDELPSEVIQSGAYLYPQPLSP